MSDEAELDSDDGHCYFRRQPNTTEENAIAVRALQFSCCGALRYSGEDAAVLQQLVSVGRGDCCDILDPPGDSADCLQ
jgi:hypothetical protein